MGCISVDFDIEDVSATGECVVWSFDLRLVLRSTFEIYRHMVRVGIIVLVSYSRDDSELLSVATGETSGKTFCRGSEHAVVMLVCLAELVDLAAHEGHDAEAELLSLGRLSVMLSDKGDEGFCQSDETDTESTMVDHSLDGVVVTELLAVHPKGAHQKRELLLESCLLEVEPLVELLCCNLKY